MKWNQTLRRHFLQGAGKSALILPLLPSLLSRKAEAQAAAAPRQKSFIGIPVWNHIPYQYNADETEARVTPSVYMPSFVNMKPTVLPGLHTIHAKNLIDAKNDNPRGQISDVIDATFNPYLSRMLMLQGLDYLTGWPHHGGHFGNGHLSLDKGIGARNPAIVNIDQVMAFSPSFYQNGNLRGQYVHFTGTEKDTDIAYEYYGNTFTYADPARPTGGVVATNPIARPAVLWDKYFPRFFTQPAPGALEKRKTLVDTVIGDYQALLGGTRLGKDDRVKVERHLSLLQDTQKNVMTASVVCDKPARTVPVGIKATLQAHNDIIAALIACGLCHSFLARILSYVMDDNDAWHAWSHNAAAGGYLKQQLGGVARDVALDLAKKLDAHGLLDDSLIALVSEHGRTGHINMGASVVLIGSAGGSFKTGQFIDYRDMNSGDNVLPNGKERSGFPMNQMWANMLMAVGVPPGEFEPQNPTVNNMFSPGNSGYGSNLFDVGKTGVTDIPGGYSPKFNGHNMSTWLPLVKA